MPRKPNAMYRQITQQAYTRREYMGGVPMNRIAQFESGDKTRDFSIRVVLVAEERCHIRHTAMEAARITLTRQIEKAAGKGNYHMKYRMYPHHVLRENKQATGAGADRVSQGMRRAFGKPIGTAARVEADQPLIEMATEVAYFPAVKEALRKAGHKLPTPTRIVFLKGQELIK